MAQNVQNSPRGADHPLLRSAGSILAMIVAMALITSMIAWIWVLPH